MSVVYLESGCSTFRPQLVWPALLTASAAAPSQSSPAAKPARSSRTASVMYRLGSNLCEDVLVGNSSGRSRCSNVYKLSEWTCTGVADGISTASAVRHRCSMRRCEPVPGVLR